MKYLYEYSTFESIQAMDETIKEHIEINQYELNDTDRDIIMTLARYSVKYKGVAHLKVDTIAGIVSKSSITVRRSLNKLEALGIIEKIEFMRAKSGGNGANIYRFLAVDDRPEMIGREESGKLTQASDEAINEPIESINLKSNSNNTDDTQPTNEQIIHESLTNNTPEAIVGLFRPFFYGSELYRYIGLLFKAKYRPHAKIRIETHIDDFRACIYDVMRRYKQGYIRNLDAYLFASIRALSRRLFLENMATVE